MARLIEKNTYLIIKQNEIVKIHPSSSLYNKNVPLLSYIEIIITKEEYIRYATAIEAEDIITVFPKLYTADELLGKD